MGRSVAFAGGAILLLLLYQFGARPTAPVMEADIQSRAAAAITDNGFANVLVGTDGRDVTLTGSVSNEADVAAPDSASGSGTILRDRG